MPSAKRKATGGGAGALVNTAIGVYLGQTSHPHWAMFLYGLAALSVIYAALQWRWVQCVLGLEPIARNENSDSQSVKSGRDASGINQFGNIHGDVNIAGYHKETALLQKEKVAYPTLKLDVSMADVIYSEFTGQWNFALDNSDSRNRKALIVIVKNPPAEVGRIGYSTGLVVCHIQFFDKEFHMPLATVDRGYWVDESCQKINIEPGQTQQIIVATSRETEWVAYPNPHKFRAAKRFSRNMPTRDLDERPIEVSKEIVFEVSIISAINGYTLNSQPFRLWPQDGKYVAMEDF